MVRDLHVPVEIVAAETVREADGLALSSRNAYLSAGERQAAGVLFRALTAAERAIAAGERRGDEVRKILREVLESEPLAQIEYAEAVDGGSFQPLDVLRGQVVLPLAVRIGGTRLIDNFQLVIAES
jgi:pantoate--beta-alanine ligase